MTFFSIESYLQKNPALHDTWKTPSMEQPIIVAGLYRGGTSMITGCLAACGAWTGYTMPGNKFNAKGYFENESLKSVLHLMLSISGYNDSDDLPPENLPNIRPKDRLHHILEMMLLSEGYHEGPWVMKNPKIPFFWRYFDEIYPEAKWLIVRRDKEQVAKSMMRVNVLTFPMVNEDRSFENMMRIVESYYFRLDSMKKSLPKERVFEVNSEDVASGNLEIVEKAAKWAGLSYDQDAVKAFVDPSLYTTGTKK